MRTSEVTASALALIFSSFTCAHSAIVETFSDSGGFVSATGATGATGALPDLGLISGGASATHSIGSVTLSLGAGATQLYIGTANSVPPVTNDDWTLRLPGPDIAISAIENLNLAFSSAVYSVGFDFVEPQADPNLSGSFIDSQFELHVFAGTTEVGSTTFSRPNDLAAFVGIWSDTSFDRVEIREVVGDSGNEFFGQIYTGTNSPSVDVERSEWGIVKRLFK